MLRIDHLEGAAGAGNICARLCDHAGRKVRVGHQPARWNAGGILLPKPAGPAANVGNTSAVWEAGGKHVIKHPGVPASRPESFEQTGALRKVFRGPVLRVVIGMAHGYTPAEIWAPAGEI
jgi:hypothetical protein